MPFTLASSNPFLPQCFLLPILTVAFMRSKRHLFISLAHHLACTLDLIRLDTLKKNEQRRVAHSTSCMERSGKERIGAAFICFPDDENEYEDEFPSHVLQCPSFCLFLSYMIHPKIHIRAE